MQNDLNNQQTNNAPIKVKLPGEKEAMISLILGIIGVVFLFILGLSFISFILGIIGIIFASKAKNLGFTGGMRTAGFILSLVNIALGIIIFIIAMIAGIGLFLALM